MENAVSRNFPDLDCPFPNCGAESLRQTDATYECRRPDCNFRISKYIAGRELSPEEAAELLTTRQLPQRDGFTSRFNKPFSAALELVQSETKAGKTGKWKTQFVFDGDENGNGEDLTEDHFLKTLTLADGNEVKLYATEKAYHVPALKTDDGPEGFRLGKTILQRELRPAEVESLLTAGKTALLEGFVSKRTKRPFSAHLTLDLDSGKIGFEFPPRENGKKTAKAK
jgi:DNA topoisomerase-3